MTINNVKPVGDDQRWKQEVERELKRLSDLVNVLQAQVNSRSQ